MGTASSLRYSERALLDAAREGKDITVAEIEVLTDRLVRHREEAERLRGVLQAIANHEGCVHWPGKGGCHSAMVSQAKLALGQD